MLPRTSAYGRLLRNRTFLLIWGGQTVSGLGNTLFDIAVMWLVYVRTGSALQTGIIGVLFQLTAVVLAPVGGVVADRVNRKRLMVGVSVLSALIVTIAAVPLVAGYFSPLLIYGTVVTLTAAGLFYNPAYFSVMPDIVGTDLLATAGGLSSAVGQGTSFIGAALAGLILAVLGAAWALIGDAISFVAVAVAIALARMPPDTRDRRRGARSGLLVDLREGWRVVRSDPVVSTLVWLAALVNVVALGPLFPALVRVQLHGGSRVYGGLEAAFVVGGIAGALAAGALEKKVGVGRLTILAFVIGGLAFSAMGLSGSIPLTGALAIFAAFWLAASEVADGALRAALIPPDVRGRASGFVRATAVIGMPASILLGGWAVDRFGPGPIFVIEGLWGVGVGVIGWSNPHLRAARLDAAGRNAAVNPAS